VKEDTVKRIFRAIRGMDEPEYGKVTIVFQNKRPVHAVQWHSVKRFSLKSDKKSEARCVIFLINYLKRAKTITVLSIGVP